MASQVLSTPQFSSSAATSVSIRGSRVVVAFARRASNALSASVPEVVAGSQWILSGFAAKIAAHVTPVFAQQRVCSVLWMALEEDEQLVALLVALFPFDERINTGFNAPGQHLVPAVEQQIFRNAVPAGMRHLQIGRRVRRERMRRDAR